MRNALLTCSGIIALGLILPVRAPAAVKNVVLADGSLIATTNISDCFGLNCNDQRCGNAPATATFSLTPGQTSATVDQPECKLENSVDPSIKATASGKAMASVTDSGSGGQHTITVRANGTAKAMSTFPNVNQHGANALTDIKLSGGISFQITDHAESVSISPTILGSGFRFGHVFALSTPTGDFSFGHDGLNDVDLPDTLPRNSVQPPGSYGVTFQIEIGALGDKDDPLSVTDGNFDLTLTVTIGSSNTNEIHWINPAGGDFNVTTNWDPQQVPVADLTRSDTAVFDLAGNTSAVPILANNNAVAALIIRHMNVDLNAVSSTIRALGSSGFSFEVDDAGALELDNGVQFQTSSAVVGNQIGAESSVFVSGANTKWSSVSGAPSDQLLIGSGAPGKVVVDHDALLSSNNDINVGATAAGTLRVESGGQVNAPNCTMNNGSIQVRGEGANASKVDIASDLSITGKNGPASLVIENSGNVDATRVLVGDPLSTGAVAVTIADTNGQGAPTALVTLGTGVTFHVAGSVNAQVDVQDGAALTTADSARIGEDLAVGKVLVHGQHDSLAAHWDVASDLTVGGKIAASELAISDGGRVAVSGSLFLGSHLDELGSTTVSGETSSLSAGFLLAVGNEGKGTLDITDGAKVTSDFGNVGVSRLVSNTDPPLTGGTGQGLVTIGDNSLAEAEWHVNFDCFVGIAEPGTIILKGLAFGPVNLGGATLRVGGQVQVGVQGAILGFGKLAANNVANHGTISPGLSPGTITIEGNYEQKPDGVLKIEIAGLDDGQFDVLNVTGDATLAGTLEVHFLNGFLPRSGESFDFLTVGGNVTGNFSQITFPELADGFNADLGLSSDRKLRLTARTDAVAGAGFTIMPATELSTIVRPPAVCGAGACGASAASMLPLMLLGLFGMQRRIRCSPA